MPTAVRKAEFWARVQRGGPDECWPWTGYAEKGYGLVYDGKRMRPAHEMALTYATGEVRPTGMDTCHSCHTPLCCNPAHLRFDTRRSNVEDAIRAGRHSRGEIHGMSKLTEHDVIEMRRRRKAGETARSLASAYNLSVNYVYVVLRGDRWSHLPL